MKMKCIIMVVFLLALCCSLQAGIKKSNLRVLYVGGTPDMDTYSAQHDSLETARSVAERMAAFEEMLKRYFKHVTVMNAKDYKAELSNNYDVTVMDGRPEPIEPEVRITNASGRLVDYKKPGYLPQDFDRPMLMIADMSSDIGSRIGLKTDWYCLCLDADAHHLRVEHPIFNEPFPVRLTMVMKPTPEAGKMMPYFAGGPTPDSLPMWRVQKVGYESKKGMRIGMVARPGGFEDSPEAEFISGGVSAKTLDAVAIGRHGNFFHWGFAASPVDMTEEAQDVLANAIVYIARFAGQTPIARKYNERIITRDAAKSFAAMATREVHEKFLREERERDKYMLDLKQAALKKQEKGEALETMDEYALRYKSPEPRNFETYLQDIQPELFAKFGTNEKAYADYYNANYDYFVEQEGGYQLVIDEDVKSLGIPNNDIRLLDKAIGMLEQGIDTGKAHRILTRYTLCRFSTPAEWRGWYEANKSKLFFTESGGWLFMVNTRDKSVPGNDYRVRDGKSGEQTSRMADTDDQNPVQMAAAVESLPNGNRKIVIRVKIHPGYHIYAHVAQADPFVPTTFDIRLPDGVREVGKLQEPSGRVYNKAGTVVYEKEAVFQQEIEGKATGDIVCTVRYQCCDDHICMPPTEKKFVLK